MAHQTFDEIRRCLRFEDVAELDRIVMVLDGRADDIVSDEHDFRSVIVVRDAHFIRKQTSWSMSTADAEGPRQIPSLVTAKVTVGRTFRYLQIGAAPSAFAVVMLRDVFENELSVA